MNARYRPITRLGLGGTGLGDMYHATSDTAAHATVDAAWDAGIRYFDTAPHYGAGLSEHRFGQALRRRPRDEYTLSTKVGRLLVPHHPGEIQAPFVGALPFRRVLDYTADGVRRAVEDSLQRLALGHVDIVLANAGILSFGDAHELSEETWAEMIDINLSGVWRTAKAAIPHLIRQGTGGSIVLTASVAGSISGGLS